MFAFAIGSVTIDCFGEISPKHRVYYELIAKEDLRALPWARVPQVRSFYPEQKTDTAKGGGTFFMPPCLAGRQAYLVACAKHNKA